MLLIDQQIGEITAFSDKCQIQRRQLRHHRYAAAMQEACRRPVAGSGAQNGVSRPFPALHLKTSQNIAELLH